MPISTLASRRLSQRDVSDSIEYSQRKVGSLRNSRWKPLANVMLSPAPRVDNHVRRRVEPSDEQKQLDAELWRHVAQGNIESAKRVIAQGGNLTALDAMELEGLFAETHATDNEVLEMDPTRIGKLESELPSSVSGRWPKLEWSGKAIRSQSDKCLIVSSRSETPACMWLQDVEIQLWQCAC